LARLGAGPAHETLGLERKVTRGPAVRAPRRLDAPIEGRDSELASALDAVARADAGDGGALLVTGPLGSGKTRLAEAMLAEAEERGLHTLRGAVHAEEGHPPYAPVVEALDPLVERRPELAGALGDSARAALARLLPSAPGPPGAAGETVDRHRLFSAVAQLLGQAAVDRGAVLVLDDLGAADEATAALVHYV